MEPEGSLPHSQVPATYPYPEPARSSPQPHIPIPKFPSWYYSLIYAWVFQVVSFPQVSPPKPCIRLYPHPNVLHIPPISFFSILSPGTILGEEYRSLSSSLCIFLHSIVILAINLNVVRRDKFTLPVFYFFCSALLSLFSDTPSKHVPQGDTATYVTRLKNDQNDSS